MENLASQWSGEQAKVDAPLRVAIVNDYEVIIRGVQHMLKPFARQIEVVELDVDRSPARPVEIALFDAFGAGNLGLERVRSLARSGHVGAVVVYAWAAAPAARELARDLGAAAVVSKSLSASALVSALEAVGRGEEVPDDGFPSTVADRGPTDRRTLTAREREVLALLATGMANRHIADALFVSENTVRSHLKSIFRKVGVRSRSHAVAWALMAPTPADAES